MIRSLRLYALAPFALGACSTVQVAPNPVASLLSAEEHFTQAVVGKDVEALGRVLSDELVYVHASGQAQSKPEYLQGTVEGGWRVISARISERRANVYGDMGVTLGAIAYDVGAGERQARYMAVYRKEQGKWLLLRWQNAKPSTPAGSN